LLSRASLLSTISSDPSTSRKLKLLHNNTNCTLTSSVDISVVCLFVLVAGHAEACIMLRGLPGQRSHEPGVRSNVVVNGLTCANELRLFKYFHFCCGCCGAEVCIGRNVHPHVEPSLQGERTPLSQSTKQRGTTRSCVEILEFSRLGFGRREASDFEERTS
jgi:hypothetical protein